MFQKVNFLISVTLAFLFFGFTSGFAAKTVGVTAAVNQSATGKLPGGKVRSIKLGNKVYFKQRIDTQGAGIVQVLFSDGSTVMVGANSSLVVDEYIYNPNKGTGKLAISFGKGVMRFIGGKVSKGKDAVTIRTVVGTAGIRGGMANIAVSGNKGIFSFLFGRDLTFKGLNGEKRRIYTQGYTLLATSNNKGGYHRLLIRRTQRGDTDNFARRLVGVASQKGGARHRPTNNQVARSAVSRGGSNIPFPRVKPKDLLRGIPGVPRFDLERDKLDSASDFDRDVVCITPTVAMVTTPPPSVTTPPPTSVVEEDPEPVVPTPEPEPVVSIPDPEPEIFIPPGC